MRKSMKSLLAVTAMMMSAAFVHAQTDMTDRMNNANIDEGLMGWNVEFTPSCIWKVEQNKSEDRSSGYWGFEGQALGIWNSSNASVGDNALTQTLRNLPNGTYVFSALMGAMIQGGEVENRDDVQGVYLVAGDDQLPVATNNVEARQPKQAHAWRFNVATTVSDGMLTVGVRCKNTTATYIAFDEATLRFYGSTPADEALRLERLGDLDVAVKLGQALAEQTMNKDSLDVLNGALATAEGVTTVEAAETAEETIRLAMLDARKSASDYKKLADRLADAKATSAQEWSDQVDDELETLKACIAEADVLYAEATAERPAVNEMCTRLKDAMDRVQLDKLFDVIDALQNFLMGDVTDEERALLGLGDDFVHPGFGTELGELPESVSDNIADYCIEIQDAMDAIENGTGTVADALTYVSKVMDFVAQCLKAVIGYDAFPITLGEVDGLPGETLTGDAGEYYHFASRTFHFAAPVSHLRLTVTNTLGCVTVGNGYTQKNGKGIPWFNIAELGVYDEEGNPIEVGPEQITYNYKQSNEGTVEAMFDGDITSYYHSLWSSDTEDYHYIEVALPENTYSFSFFIENQAGGINHRSMDSPVEIVLTGITETAALLTSAIADAEIVRPRIGQGPGCVSDDISSFVEALDEAKALLENGGTDDEQIAAIERLEAAEAAIDGYQPNAIKDGTYTFTSAYSKFFELQGEHKAMYWNEGENLFSWKTINAADAALMQFEFTEVESDVEGEQAFILRNVGSGKYVTKFGESYHLLGTNESDSADVIYFEYLGKGAYRVHTSERDDAGDFYGYFHTESHSSGNGTAGKVCQWYDELETGSAWYLEQTTVLPIQTLAQGGRTDCFHLFEPVNCILVQATSACSFEGMTITDAFGNTLSCTIEAGATEATITFDTPTDMFALTLGGGEDVTLTISNVSTRINALQKEVDATRALGLEEGPNVGDISDLSKVNAALAEADKLLQNGGSEEEIDAAIEALRTAVSELEYRMPDPDKEYFLISAYDLFMENRGVNMAIYDGQVERPCWSYLNTENPVYRWKLEHQPDVPLTDDAGEPTGEVKDGGYIIRNVGTGRYISTDYSQPTMSAEGVPYLVLILQGEACHIEYEGVSGAFLHAEGHGGGTGYYGQLCYYWATLGTASTWRVVEAETLVNELDVISIEPDVQNVNADAIYDLFGRRVTDPQPRTIYIQAGKKFIAK